MKRCNANDPNYDCPRPSGNSSNIIPTTVDSLSALPDDMQNELSRAQVIKLERWFAKYCYLSKFERSELAKTLRTTEARVEKWFSNRRRQMRTSEGSECPIDMKRCNANNPDSLSALPDDMQNDNFNRRTRNGYSRAQVLELEQFYAKEKYIRGPELSKLAKRIRTTEDRVKIWFCNRRQRDKGLQMQILKSAQSNTAAGNIPHTVAAAAPASAGSSHALDPVLMNPYSDPLQMAYGVGVPVPQLPFPYFPNTPLATPATALPLAYDKILQPIPPPTTHAINRPNSNTAFDIFHHNNSSSAFFPPLTYTQHCTPSSWPNYYNQNHSSAMHNTEQQNAKETVETSSPTEREEDFEEIVVVD